MIKHIVCWRVKEEANGESKAEIMQNMQTKLMNLVPIIAEIKGFEVGINYNPTPAAFDVSLYSVFESNDALEKYVAHPAHQEVVKYIVSVVKERMVVDYEM